MPDKKIELPKLPYGEGSMVLMPDGETIQYRKVINGKRVAVYASSVKEALTKMKARKKEIEEIKKKQIRQEKRTETLKEAMTRWLYNYKIMNYDNEELLTKLIHLKLDHPALWNGDAGGEMKFLKVSSERVLAYQRENEEDRIVVVLNLSDSDRTLTLTMDCEFEGKDLMTADTVSLNVGANELTLKPWEFLILCK